MTFSLALIIYSRQKLLIYVEKKNNELCQGSLSFAFNFVREISVNFLDDSFVRKEIIGIASFCYLYHAVSGEHIQSISRFDLLSALQLSVEEMNSAKKCESRCN